MAMEFHETRDDEIALVGYVPFAECRRAVTMECAGGRPVEGEEQQPTFFL